jgi:serine/threonine protein kinase
MKTRRQKYRQKMHGGSILGEGAHGITYNLCKKDKESFCDELDKEIIHEITLYTVDGIEKLSKKEEIDTFLDMLHKKQEYIAKIFKSSGVFVSTTKEKFESEIHAHRNIIKIYNKKATKYLTIILSFHNIMGAIFHGNTTYYAIFGSKCNNKYELVLPQFLIDILESIQILQTHDYSHNDIKPANIVKCSDRYKLIDWGQSSIFNKNTKPAAIITSSPLRWYCYDWKITPCICTGLLPFRATMLEPAAAKSSLFKEIVAKINHDFLNVLKRGLSRDELYDTYKYSFDLFMLGMTLVYLIHDKPSYHKQYTPIIYYLTSLTDPPKNAKEALKHIKSLLK